MIVSFIKGNALNNVESNILKLLILETVLKGLKTLKDLKAFKLIFPTLFKIIDKYAEKIIVKSKIFQLFFK